MLVLPYALFRWGSGREAVIGLGVILAWLVVTHVADPTGAGEMVADYGFFLSSAALGAAIRFQATVRVRDVEQARLRQRNELARELHDSVGHHVSAIAVQAQAGRALAAPHPARALAVLATIEEAASRTLEEMRAMVGVLRDGAEPDFAPQPAVGDIERLARESVAGRVLTCGCQAISPISPRSVGGALYRLAQESVTNAIRHARACDPDHRPRRRRGRTGTPDRPRRRRRHDRPCLRGYGIVGMTERATLLGGTLRAGPAPAAAGRSTRCSRSGARRDGKQRSGRSQDMTIRVLIADDQDIVRAGLTMILDAQPGIEVVGEAANGREAVALARELRPDVCLFDIRMPEMDGIEATRQLAGPDVDDPLAVIVITTFDLDEYVHGALKAGARGFLLKNAGPELLTQAIHAAAHGDALIAPSITARLLAAFAAHHPGQPPAQPIEPLTSREEEILIPVAHRLDQPRDRRRPAHQPQHRQDAPRQPHAQAQCSKPRRDRHVGLRNRPDQQLTGLPLVPGRVSAREPAAGVPDPRCRDHDLLATENLAGAAAVGVKFARPVARVVAAPDGDLLCSENGR